MIKTILKHVAYILIGITFPIWGLPTLCWMVGQGIVGCYVSWRTTGPLNPQTIND